MNSIISKTNLFYLAVLFSIGMVACNKNEASKSSASSSSVTTSSTSAAVPVGVDSASGDTIYVVQQCPWGYYRDSIGSSSLPTAITALIDSNFASFTFTKSYSIQDSAGSVYGYLVIIQYNNKPVAILFNSAGTFGVILQQWLPGTAGSQNWQNGNRFANRNHPDSIAISSLPSSITNYFSTNYPNDTLVKAYQGYDSNYVVISLDSGVYATVFNSSGSFVKRVSLSASPRPNKGNAVSVAQDSLPSNVQSYLTTTYPGYVFEKAFSISNNSGLQGYVVVIDANSTKYAVLFDSSGNYVSVRTIW